jgi:hypothetical protein
MFAAAAIYDIFGIIHCIQRAIAEHNLGSYLLCALFIACYLVSLYAIYMGTKLYISLLTKTSGSSAEQVSSSAPENPSSDPSGC